MAHATLCDPEYYSKLYGPSFQDVLWQNPATRFFDSDLSAEISVHDKRQEFWGDGLLKKNVI